MQSATPDAKEEELQAEVDRLRNQLKALENELADTKARAEKEEYLAIQRNGDAHRAYEHLGNLLTLAWAMLSVGATLVLEWQDKINSIEKAIHERTDDSGGAPAIAP